jgi:hypothetical protein
MELEFSGQIFEVYWNIKFHEGPSTESWVFPRERSCRHVEAYGRFSQFCNRA